MRNYKWFLKFIVLRNSLINSFTLMKNKPISSPDRVEESEMDEFAFCRDDFQLTVRYNYKETEKTRRKLINY